MKKGLLTLTIFFAIAANAQDDGKIKVTPKIAKVEQIQGLYIFTDAEPLAEYDYLGTIKGKMTWSGQYQSVRDGIISRAKKQYPSADGVILILKDGGTDRADCIKFKN